MEYQIKAILDNKAIYLDSEFVDKRTELITNFYRKVIDTENYLIKNALIKLGWTPPKGERMPEFKLLKLIKKGPIRNRVIKIADKIEEFELSDEQKEKLMDLALQLGAAYAQSQIK